MSELIAAEASISIDLYNQFLMAMPGVVGGELAGTVIYICEHSEKGALGLVINRPTDLSLAGLLEKIDLEFETAPQDASPIFFGGPVHTDRGFVLHSPPGDFSSSIKLGDLALTTSRDVLQAVAAGTGPEKILITLGYAGWGAGQLENEISQNAWLTVAADAAAMKLLGIDPSMLTGVAGHA